MGKTIYYLYSSPARVTLFDFQNKWHIMHLSVVRMPPSSWWRAFCYHGAANVTKPIVLPLWQITPTGITQIISEAALQITQNYGMTDKARVCLVYEEAHSLIPEWNSVAVEGDKSATNGTAVLHERSYRAGSMALAVCLSHRELQM